MIAISNCPITGLERKIVEKNTLFYETSKQLVLECFIKHFKDGEVIDNSRIKSYAVSLKADNTTPVNSQTGEQLEDTPENWALPTTIGQFDFFCFLQTIPVTQSELILQHITNADNLGRFNA